MSLAMSSKSRARAAAAAVLAAASLACAAPGGARAAPAIAMHGAPALPEGFAHFPYADPAAPKGGRLRLCLLGTFDSLNPFNLKAGSTAQGLNTMVFESLMARSQDEPFTLYGLIASGMDTDEARSFATFHLDPAARFSDGTPITADDVRFTFDLLKAKGRPQQRQAFAEVKGVSTPDPRTVRFDLAGIGDRELPLFLGLMPVLPRHGVDAAHFDESTLKPPLASGPYRVAAVEPGTRLVLERNPAYWGADLPSRRGMFNFDRVDIDYYRDANSLFEVFKAGLCDFRIETDPARWLTGYDVPIIRDGRDVKEAVPLRLPKGMEGFAFNTRRPLFADVRVREALGAMFDFGWVNRNLYGGLYRRTPSFFAESPLASTGRPADADEAAILAPYPGAVRPDMLDGSWLPPAGDASGRDRAEARRALALLASAGDRLDGTVMRQADGTPFRFEIMVVDRRQERLALAFSDSLRDIGIEAVVRLVDEVQYQRRRQGFDFDMMLGQWTASPSPGAEQRSRWTSAAAAQPASFNLPGARSPAIDAAVTAILEAKTQDGFTAAVRTLDRLLLSGFYIVPLFHTEDQWIAYASRLGRPATVPLFGFNNVTPIELWWQKPGG
ncbi:ABC transporter substrate-binding protein [Lichenibacterium ramalinae]|uniref:ABC transporter substrate-binding protein n=2 Tax=Lichenibacterium ramalinae TaxID=2316527 RepID=A0A4Q2R9U3_9HYPH|nr:ABC transporter substrate-binding protein [Lichenibacterium ramalinae]